MPTIPIRTLGKIGVITDVNAFDLPPEAVSSARNVRFSNGRITNSHVWREAIASPTGGIPSFMFTASSTGSDEIMGYMARNGRAYHIVNGAISEVTPGTESPRPLIGYDTSGFSLDFLTDQSEVRVPASSDFVENLSDATRTFCALQGVLYINQEDRVPWYKTSGNTVYNILPNWTSTNRCKVLRGYKDFLVALNVTKSGAAYPNMVKWSNIAQYDSVPDSWDPADTTKSAGENTLAEIQTDILDGMTLRNSFIIYATDQAWTMEYTQGPDVFQFYKLFGDRGIVNTNCVAEVDGLHFVLDDDDIYMHDGVSPPKSIVDKRVKSHIFRNMDLTKAEKFFVYHERSASEVWFCFNSKLGNLKWLGSACTYCNYAAVYNYSEDTWTFHDLPNVSSMSSVGWQITPTYATTTLAYDTTGSSYADLIPNNTNNSFAASVAEGIIATTRITQVDSGLGTALPFNAASELAVVPFTERTGLDLDELVPELRTYKNYRSIYPQTTVEDASAPFSFKFGGVDMPSQNLEWDTLQTFEPTTEYKLDTRSRGRYLAWYFEGANNNTYSLSGFDLDFVAVSRR